MNQIAQTWPFYVPQFAGEKLYGMDLWIELAATLAAVPLTDEDKAALRAGAKAAEEHFTAAGRAVPFIVEQEAGEEGVTNWVKYIVPVNAAMMPKKNEAVNFELNYFQPEDIGAEHCELLRFTMMAGNDQIVALNTEDSVTFDFNDTIAVGVNEERTRLANVFKLLSGRGDFEPESKTCLEILAIGLAQFA